MQNYRSARSGFVCVILAVALSGVVASETAAHVVSGDPGTPVATGATAVASQVIQAITGELQSGDVTTPQPAMAAAFEQFKSRVKYRWDARWLYVESNGLPSHDMMVGITAWQQQVPLPKSYVGANAWQIPLHPVPSKNPVSIKGRFLRGAIAVAVNGIPIFNPQNNRGEVSAEIGELDQWGGHCGRGDDYHYHVAPWHLEKVVGVGKPIAYALDGYPIYGTAGPDGQPVDEKTLDAFHGKTDSKGNYAYYASTKYPYLNGGFHGEVTEIGGQVDPQPSGSGVRPALRPLRGARITAFKRSDDDRSFSLEYTLDAQTYHVNYAVSSDGGVKFEFIDGKGQVRSETYQPHRRVGDRGGNATEINPTPAARNTRTPFTDNNDGTVADNFTGLVWQKVDHGESTWEKASADAKDLRLGGRSDWRLPTLNELLSLTNHSVNPAIDLHFFPSNPRSPAQYWWTSQHRDADRVWVVNRGGGTGAKPKNETVSAGGKLNYNARYVSGPTRESKRRYIDNGNGSVTDMDSGLMWTQAPGPAMDWDAAGAYAAALTVGGFKDWRLPDVKEMASLIDFDWLTLPDPANTGPCIDRTLFPLATADAYWTATRLRSPEGGQAWYVDLADGSLKYAPFSHSKRVFAVRTVTPAEALSVGPHSYFHPEDAPPDQQRERAKR